MAGIAASKSLKWPLKLVFLTLLAVLAYFVAKVVISFTNPESLWESGDLQSSAPVTSSAKAQSYSFTSDPFNSSKVETVIDEAVLNADVPETTLNLKMTGRIAGDNGNAILRTSDNKEAVYKIGDEVISDVVLKAVNKDFVVLSVNGQLQRLTFERNEDIGLSGPKASSAPKTISPKPKQSVDMLSMLQNVNLRRSMKGGKLQGYKVKSNRPDVDLTQFGFKRGDIVTAVDGKDITQGNIDMLKLYQEAAQKGQVDMTVLRNGQTRRIQLGTQ